MINLLDKKRNKCRRTLMSKSLFKRSVCIITYTSLSISGSLPLSANATDTITLPTPAPTSSQTLSLSPHHLKGLRLLSSSERNFVKQSCNADTFSNVIVVSGFEPLWTVVDKFIKKDGEAYSPDYWVTFEKGNTVANRYLTPWESKNGEKKGLLVYIASPEIVDQHSLDYFTSYQNEDLTGPRLGLCGSISADKPRSSLQLTGGSAIPNDSSNNPESRHASLYISMAQIELYNLKINADNVDADASAIGLGNAGKLLLENVTFSREDTNVMDTDVGLILNNDSYVSIKDSLLKQQATEGTLVNTFGGFVNCDGSELSGGEGVGTFVGSSNQMTLSGCHFNSSAPENAVLMPTFFYDNFDESNNEDCSITDYTYCKNSADPTQDFPPSGDSVCSQLIPMCDAKANKFIIRDNIFSGSWLQIFHTRWTSFLAHNNNNFALDTNGDKLGHYVQCAAPKSFSVHGAFSFEGHACVPSAKW